MAAISSRGNEGSGKEIVLSPFGEQSELSTPLEAVKKKNKGKERIIVSPDEIEKFKKRKHEKEPSRYSFFVPICFNKHFIVAVVNLSERKIQYLDNLKINCHENDWKLVHVLKEQFSVFLQDMGHPRGVEVKSYPIQSVDFEWHNNTDNNFDCGVFLMNRMENFTGHPYDCQDLLLPSSRRKLRARYCLRIILSSLNDCRLDVLSRVLEFAKREK